jgi:hypothetical protein
MTLVRIALEGYRCFAQRQEIELHPITVVLGKNNSGKSALIRSPVVCETGIRTDSPTPLDIDTLGEDFLESFTDLVYGNRPHGNIGIELAIENGTTTSRLAATIQHIDEYDTQVISSLSLSSDTSSAALTWEPSEPPDQAKYTIVGSGARYEGVPVEFKGLLPSGLPTQALPRALVEQVRTTVQSIRAGYPAIRYLGPFRDRPHRRYRLPARMPAEIGVTGSHAAGILARDFARQNGLLLRRVNDELAQSLPGWEIGVIERGGLYSVVLTSKDDSSVTVNLADAGTGVAQVLPILVQRAIDNVTDPGSDVLEIIEQPELHLHPAAHAALADMYLSAQRSGLRFIVETHSETFLLRLRRRIAEGTSDPSIVAVYFVEQDNGAAKVHRITVDSSGNLDRWPEGVFSEDYEETQKLAEAQLAKGDPGAR